MIFNESTIKMASTGVIPIYQRFVNGAPVPSSGRRSFRPREKYLILLVFLTFGIVCFGTFFFLPEYKGLNTVNNVYIKVYEQFQNAPQLLKPPLPHSNDIHNEIGIVRHGDSIDLDPHKLEDKVKLLAKIEQDLMNEKLLERPNVVPSAEVSLSSKSILKTVIPPQLDNQNNKDYIVETLPPAQHEKNIVVQGGEDKDPVARARRNKIKEVSDLHSSNNH